ncbi:MAG TPA: pantoate--beta-alanine ligase [Nitrospirales bacterium]
MRTIRTRRAIQTWARERRTAGESIGFVPTMGALHEGHASLIRAAKRQADAVAVSIFVNPLQFGPSEDLARYPRSTAEDVRLCRAEGVDVVFLPTVQELYPAGFQTTVRVKELTERYEGQARPGHFDGVTTVVAKLFHLIGPNRAFFGQKDYQQVVVIKQMVKDLDLPIDVVVRPTVREPDGLALSSRNRMLSARERKAAGVLFGALMSARRLVESGERSAKKGRNAMIGFVRREPLARLDYAALVDPATLQVVDNVKGRAVLLLAVWIGKTRLIDNMVITCP